MIAGPAGAARPARALPARLLLVGGLLVGGLLTAGPAAANSGRDRLAADLELSIGAYLKTSPVPEHDRARVAKCLGDSIVADIPVADAARLSDIIEARAAPDPALQKQWITINKKDAPARHEQVLGEARKKCADLVPYIEPMM